MSKVFTLLSQARSALTEFFTEEEPYWPEAKRQKELPTRGQIEAEKKITGTISGRISSATPSYEEVTQRIPLAHTYGKVELSGKGVGWTPTFPSVLGEKEPTPAEYTLIRPYEYQVHINSNEREPVFETMMRDYPEQTMFVLDLLERRNASRRVSNAQS